MPKIIGTTKLTSDGKITLIADVRKKLNVGIEVLKSIKGDTSALPEIKDMLGSFVVEQRDFNQEMREHNKRLEKILEKLAEK